MKLTEAERALAEAVEVMRPVADVTLPWGDIGAGMILARDVQAARAFVAQHGSDSSTTAAATTGENDASDR